VFFWVSQTWAISYHLNSLKVQELGILDLPSLIKSFPYTPCWIGELRAWKQLGYREAALFGTYYICHMICCV
jgi:hypothetical protein